MASIREKRAGVWEVRVFVGYDDAGRPVQASRTIRGGKRDAQQLAAQLTSSPMPRSGKLTVAELLDMHLEHSAPTWSATTRHDYGLGAARVKADPIGGRRVSRVNVAEIDQWHLRMRKAGVGEAQIRNLHNLLRAAFGNVLRWGMVTANPVAAAPPKRAKRTHRDVMSAEDVSAVLAVAEEVHPLAPLAFRLAAVVGARRAEIAALRWDRLDGDQLTIDQAVAVNRAVKSGDPDRLVVSATKTGDRRRLTVDATTLAHLEEARAEAAGPWVFSEGDEPPNPDRIGHWWARARQLSGIDKQWRLHDLRHWSATHAIAGGHDLRSVAARLGHADPTTTMRTYAHAIASRDAAIAETLANELDGDG